MLSEYITSLADVSFHIVAYMYARFRYSGKNSMRFAVFWRISVRFCGFRTPLTPPSLISWKFYSKTHKLILKSNSRLTLTGSWIRSRRAFTQVKLAEQKINFKCTFCGFSFTPMSKCRNRPWNLYKDKNFLWKMYFPWPWGTECTLNLFRNLDASVGSKQAKRSDPPWRKQGRIPRNTIS